VRRTTDDQAQRHELKLEDGASVATSFPPARFPARRDELVDAAQAGYAGDSLLAGLKRIPDRVYESPGHLWAAMRAAHREEAGGAEKGDVGHELAQHNE
jgi:hypothetical protein